MGMMNGTMGGNWGGGLGTGPLGLLGGFDLLLSSLLPLLVIILVVWLIVRHERDRSRERERSFAGAENAYAGAGGQFRPAARSAEPGRALAILDERYARGEVDREEYLRRRADLAT